VDQIHTYDLASNRLSKRDGRAGASWAGRARATSALALLLALGGAGCEVDYSAPLVGGYEVVRANSSYVVVNGPMAELPTVIEPIAGPRVFELDVVGVYIVGNASAPPDVLYNPPPVAGYFVIDSSNYTRWLGLTRDEFDARCKALGIVPKLKRPSYFKK
jgi:hypothetical protein